MNHDEYLKGVRKKVRKAYRIRGVHRSNQISPGEELRDIVARHRRSLREIPPDIELWLVFLDEAIAFLFAVWGTYRERIENPSQKLSICLTALSGRVFQDAVCVRELAVGGFFVQSNVVTRSLIESIDVMHLLNSHPDLAEEFIQTEENKRSSDFWHKYCSKNKIHRIVKERWLWFVRGDEKVATSFHGQREQYTDLMGMSSHPSFASSFSTFMDSVQEESNIAMNAMGSISHMSKFTMHLILLRVFEYGILWSGPEIGLYRGDKSITKSTLHDNIEKGLSVLFSIVMTLNDPKEEDPFYPKFQTYWPKQNFE